MNAPVVIESKVRKIGRIITFIYYFILLFVAAIILF